ncbi:MAG: DUF5076 domain-containing protein [Chromatiales bacterium]
MKETKELPIPPDAVKDTQAKEIVRIWAGGDLQHISLDSQIWDDPAAWGLLLVDLARHVSAAYQQLEGSDPMETLARIKEGFDAEWNAPTDEHKGGLMD